MHNTLNRLHCEANVLWAQRHVYDSYFQDLISKTMILPIGHLQEKQMPRGLAWAFDCRCLAVLPSYVVYETLIPLTCWGVAYTSVPGERGPKCTSNTSNELLLSPPNLLGTLVL